MNAAISVRSLLEILQPKIFGDFFSSKGKGQGKQTGEDAVTPVRLRISDQLPPTCQQQVLYSCGIIFLTHLLKKVSLNSSSAVAIRTFFRERDQCLNSNLPTGMATGVGCPAKKEMKVGF
ncbi:hypothetical protein AVEN_252138-1 [Araneus ventricosus]|uniref:Uncharacterized protein n=1 Tax=Araneus ventricosus TaxID=182803 RepID=A0A4Y2HFG4_ARAVE|nr:hypothetical protein AVEN_252138-1 [Araneus ventricosus]